TEALGQAYSAQPAAVMDAVQGLRFQAIQAGTLRSDTMQSVMVQNGVVTVEPTDPYRIYVPSYNPVTVYGAWPYPSYPPYVFAVPAPVTVTVFRTIWVPYRVDWFRHHIDRDDHYDHRDSGHDDHKDHDWHRHGDRPVEHYDNSPVATPPRHVEAFHHSNPVPAQHRDAQHSGGKRHAPQIRLQTEPHSAHTVRIPSSPVIKRLPKAVPERHNIQHHEKDVWHKQEPKREDRNHDHEPHDHSAHPD
ncbi:MAG: DUF3300 domain-containing protein, partial [Alphaproteobacteria bacterium]|nr:DUF3300 domain-containing protein [Alphaproteobacteria bacterium]